MQNSLFLTFLLFPYFHLKYEWLSVVVLHCTDSCSFLDKIHFFFSSTFFQFSPFSTSQITNLHLVSTKWSSLSLHKQNMIFFSKYMYYDFLLSRTNDTYRTTVVNIRNHAASHVLKEALKSHWLKENVGFLALPTTGESKKSITGKGR